MFWAGAHVDNTQMLPSPFDNVHGGANAVSHVPSSMQQSSAEGDNKAAGDHLSCFLLIKQHAMKTTTRSVYDNQGGTLYRELRNQVTSADTHGHGRPQSWVKAQVA